MLFAPGSPLNYKLLKHSRHFLLPILLRFWTLSSFSLIKRQRSLSANVETTGSFLETAQVYIGAGVGPGDLSTNSEYMEGRPIFMNHLPRRVCRSPSLNLPTRHPQDFLRLHITRLNGAIGKLQYHPNCIRITHL